MIGAGAAAGERGGAKAGSLRLGVIPVGGSGQEEEWKRFSHAPEELVCLPPKVLLDRLRLF